MALDGDWVPIPGTSGTSSKYAYHYTNTAGLLGILQSGTLWASSPLGLNDMSEIEYGFDVFKGIWEAEYSGRHSGRVGAALHALLADASSAISELQETIYFLCASSDGDLLNQWQHYAGAQGYAIGLDTGVPLAPLVSGPPPVPPAPVSHRFPVVTGWVDVVYDREEQETRARTILNFMFDRLEEPEGVAEASIPLMVALNVIRFKHHAFSAERELRFVMPRVGAIPEQFRAGPRGVVPYINLTQTVIPSFASPHSNARRRVPVVEVMCGPMTDPEGTLIRRTVERLLASTGYSDNGGPVPVRTSDVPYRP